MQPKIFLSYVRPRPSDKRVIPLLQEIEVAGANGKVKFLTGSFKIAVSAHAQLKWSYSSFNK